MSKISQESGEEPGIEEVPWIGQAPLDIYLDELNIARNDPEVAGLVRLNWGTLERLGEVGHLFLKTLLTNITTESARSQLTSGGKGFSGSVDT